MHALRRPTRLVAAMLAAAIVVCAPGIAQASSADDDYPSWDDVQRAQHSEAATAAEVTTVRAALERAQAEASTASMRAVHAQQAAHEADARLAQATERAQTLAAAADAAEQAAGEDTAAVRRFATALYRSRGTGGITLQLLATNDEDRLLERLNVLDGVTSWWKTTTEDALSRQSVATSLHGQAARAEDARADLADTAHAAAEEAQRTADDADALVDAAQERTDTLYEQLAALKGTTAEVERRYEIGVRVAAQAAAEQRQRERAAKEAAAKKAAQEAADRKRKADEAAAKKKADDQAARADEASGSHGSSSTHTPSPKPDPKPKPKPQPKPKPKPTTPASPGAGDSPAAARAYARSALGAHGWSSSQFSCLNSLWNRESGWRVTASNPYSGAYGIPQALPGSKMSAAGPDWRTSARTQVDWGLAYIAARYDSPCGAWAHSEDRGWY